jgi:hypothetical protein
MRGTLYGEECSYHLDEVGRGIAHSCWRVRVLFPDLPSLPLLPAGGCQIFPSVSPPSRVKCAPTVGGFTPLQSAAIHCK